MRSVSLVLLSVLLIPASADAGHSARRPSAAIAEPQGDANGCYWYRQREFCSHYCYWEVNGKRYCHHHEREARSQAYVFDEFLEGPAMK